MRRLLVGLMIVALVGTSAEAFRGRFGRGAHSQQQQPVTNPDPPPQNFIETLTMQTAASDGWCSGGTPMQGTGVAASATAFFIGYQLNNDCGGAHQHKVLKYDYETGQWSTSAVLATLNPACCDSHDQDTTFVDPTTGKVWNFYGGLTGAFTPSTPGSGPYYRVTTSAGDITAWDAQQNVGRAGSISEPIGGFDSSGNLLLIGGSQWGTAVVRAGEMVGAKYTAATQTWSHLRLAYTTQGAQTTGTFTTCGTHTKVYPDGTVLLMWARDFSGCGTSVDQKDVFVVKSTDTGDTFCTPSGTNCWGTSESEGLLATWDGTENTWSSVYRAHLGTVAVGMDIDQFSNGDIGIVYGDVTAGAVRFRKYTSGAWQAAVTVVVPSSIGGARPSIAINGSDHVLIYATNSGGMHEYKSTNGGASFALNATLRTKGSEASNTDANARYFASLGGKPRIIVQWRQNIDGTRTSVITMDRPQ